MLYENFDPIYPYLISEGRRYFTSLRSSLLRNLDSQENCCRILTHAKMDGRIITKLDSCGIEIARVNSNHKSILITKSANFL